MSRRTRRECRQIPYPQADARKEGRKEHYGHHSREAATVPRRPAVLVRDAAGAGPTAYGGADIDEVVTTAARISAGDYDSWYEQRAATAQRTEAEARAQLAAGHQVSARDGLLRAATMSRCPNRCVARSTSARRSSGPVTSTRR